MEFGEKLNPDHSLRIACKIKGTRQKIIFTHNPNEINQNQLLLVSFSNLSSDGVIVPGMTNLSFNIELSTKADPNRKSVSNIMKKLEVKFGGNDKLSMDDFDVFTCYQDMWKTKSKRWNAVRQGIISNNGCTPSCIKLKLYAKDKKASIAQD